MTAHKPTLSAQLTTVCLHVAKCIVEDKLASLTFNDRVVYGNYVRSDSKRYVREALAESNTAPGDIHEVVARVKYLKPYRKDVIPCIDIVCDVIPYGGGSVTRKEIQRLLRLERLTSVPI